MSSDVPYPRPPRGPERELVAHLAKGALSGRLADQFLRRGYPWYTVAPHVLEKSWWQQRSIPDAPEFSESWRIEAFDTALHIVAGHMQIWIDPGPETPDPDVPPDLILVTHAHHDHIGQLAQLARLSPGCRIVMTPGTLELLTLNGAGQALAQRLREQAVVLPVDTPRDFGSVTVRFWPAGHLLGAVMIELCHGRDKVLITGDFALRDVGGLRPDAAPSGAYTLVMMEATMADWGSLPFAAPYYNRRPVLDAVNEAIATGARIVALPAQALGQAQEIYVALTLAQRAGAFPDWQVGLTGFSAAVSDLYHASLSRARGPWRRRPWACDSRPPDHSLVITSDQYQIPGAGIVHERALTHAGWGEHMALVLGVACRHLAFYHGSATSLRIVLDEMGFHTHNLPLEN